MVGTQKYQRWIFVINSSAAIALVAIAATIAVWGAQPAQAQTFTVLHNFTYGADGAEPEDGLTFDAAGNLYGTAAVGGVGYPYGTVFELSKRNSSWVFDPVFNNFTGIGENPGAFPTSGVTIGPNGSLYATTFGGGASCNCGIVFNLRPSPTRPVSALPRWNETVLDEFTAGSDGGFPQYGTLVFDQAGNLYGTTFGEFGSGGNGTVYELSPSGEGWTQDIIYSFTGGSDGGGPYSGVIFDHAGNLYGTAYEGGESNHGTVFELSPSASGWTEKTLHIFQGGSDGSGPIASLTMDAASNLYGTTCGGGSQSGGTVFELAPSGDNWSHTVLYNFTARSCPEGSLTFDAAGNLYGTTLEGGAYDLGSVFKLTNSNGGWTFSSVHDFSGGDGEYLYGNWVTLDGQGNIYGMTAGGGTGSACAGGCGVVFEITP